MREYFGQGEVLGQIMEYEYRQCLIRCGEKASHDISCASKATGMMMLRNNQVELLRRLQ
jgi:hypothetical protein